MYFTERSQDADLERCEKEVLRAKKIVDREANRFIADFNSEIKICLAGTENCRIIPDSAEQYLTTSHNSLSINSIHSAKWPTSKVGKN